MASTLTSFGELLKNAFSAERVASVLAEPRPHLARLHWRVRVRRTVRRWSGCRTLTSSQRRRLDALRAMLVLR